MQSSTYSSNTQYYAVIRRPRWTRNLCIPLCSHPAILTCSTDHFNMFARNISSVVLLLGWYRVHTALLYRCTDIFMFSFRLARAMQPFTMHDFVILTACLLASESILAMCSCDNNHTNNDSPRTVRHRPKSHHTKPRNVTCKQ